MTREQLLARRAELQEQQRKLEAQFNYMNGQITGQIGLINELLQATEAPAEPAVAQE